MKLRDALIAWTPGSDKIRVGPLISEGDADWTAYPVNYTSTAGAAYFHVRKLSGIEARHYVMSEFIGVVGRDCVNLNSALRAFMQIDEFREAIPEDMQSEWGSKAFEGFF